MLPFPIRPLTGEPESTWWKLEFFWLAGRSILDAETRLPDIDAPELQTDFHLRILTAGARTTTITYASESKEQIAAVRWETRTVTSEGMSTEDEDEERIDDFLYKLPAEQIRWHKVPRDRHPGPVFRMDDGALQLLLAWEPAHARWAVLRYAYNESGHGLVDAPPYAVAYIAKGAPRDNEAGAIVLAIEHRRVETIWKPLLTAAVLLCTPAEFTATIEGWQN